jgi:N-methylhydantoinase B
MAKSAEAAAGGSAGVAAVANTVASAAAGDAAANAAVAVATSGGAGAAQDPVTLATVWHALQSTCREMRYIIDRTAQNYLIGQLHDVSVGIWAADGSTVAMPVGLPVQFLGSKFAVRSIIEKFGDDLRPGDVILTNDPYHGGHNCHLPDWGFFRPIFHRGELLFWTLARGHQQDTGGAFPGGYFPNSYDIHAEGLCIPPIKVVDAGRERTDVLELIWNNVRFPRGVRLDNYAMIAATRRADERIVALVDHFGAATVRGCVDAMLHRTEAAVRDEIRRIPDGVYRGEAATDDDGTDLDQPVWVRVDVTVAGDQLTLDFSRSDRQRKGFVNSVYAATYGNAVASVIRLLDPALADFHNEGSLAPIQVVAPAGLVVNCEYPATVGASPVNVGCQVAESVLQALSQALPDRCLAAWGKHRGHYMSGADHRTGDRYVQTSFDYDGSAGAVAGYDGYAGISTLTSLGSTIRGNVEEEETRFPWLILRWEFDTDHSGAGRWRGGPGMHWEARNEGSGGVMATGSSDGDVVRGFGAQGGEPSPVSRTYLVRDGERIRVKPHRQVQVRTGDTVLKLSAGGGGVGDPWERDPAAVERDVRRGFVSPEAAAWSWTRRRAGWTPAPPVPCGAPAGGSRAVPRFSQSPLGRRRGCDARLRGCGGHLHRLPGAG